MTHATHKAVPGGLCLSRRQLLVFGGASVSVIAAFGTEDLVAKERVQLVGSKYKPKRIARLADIQSKKPLEFAYPTPDVMNVLVKLNEIAGGGIGKDKDIVAFNTVCPHMGGPVGAESYKPQHNVLGPCPLHLSTFDLTKHGMIVAGHATESLPQIMLEIRKDEVWAVGVMGLVYGYAANPIG